MAIAYGTEVSILRSNVDQLSVSNRSFMPENFEKAITPEQMGDLMTYLIKATKAK